MRIASVAGVAALLSALAAGPSVNAEDAAGRWAVVGHFGGKDFTLDCRFAQSAERLTGACVDGPTGDAKIKGGRSHALTKGAASGPKVSWTYQTSAGILSFTVNYDGVRQGDHMSGKISALGKTGTFTADRSAP
jgi:hypothetical protein